MWARFISWFDEYVKGAEDAFPCRRTGRDSRPRRSGQIPPCFRVPPEPRSESLVQTGTPALALVVLVLGARLAAQDRRSPEATGRTLLTVAEAWCGLLWLVVLGEQWSGPADSGYSTYGSPLLSLATDSCSGRPPGLAHRTLSTPMTTSFGCPGEVERVGA